MTLFESDPVINHTAPCATEGCDNRFRTRSPLSAIREDGSVVGVTGYCSYCKIAMRATDSPLGIGALRLAGLTAQELDDAHREAMSTWRYLTEEEIDAVRGVYQPPFKPDPVAVAYESARASRLREGGRSDCW